MRKVALMVCLTLVSLPSLAETAPATETIPATAPEAPAAPARLDCDALKARVDAKLQAKGIPVYTLEIVPVEGAANPINAASGVEAVKVNKGKQVGTCDGGTKRLMYIRGN
jgi:hypothetical protein